MKNKRGLVGNFVNIDRERTARSQALSTKLSYRILSLCEEHGLSQGQLAIRAGLDPSYISRIIRGKTESGLVTLEALAQVFGLTLSSFFEGVTRTAQQETQQSAQDQSKGVVLSFDDNPIYLENQWAEDTLVDFERQHGDEGENLQNLGSALCHFARWCDANGLQLSEAWQIAAARYKEETDGRGRQFIVRSVMPPAAN